CGNRVFMNRFLVPAALGWLSLLLNVATAQPTNVQPYPLVLPTPAGPKLRRPEMEPLLPSPRLDERRPLQLQPVQPRPRLNVLPQGKGTGLPQADQNDVEESAPDDSEGSTRSLHLRYGR